MIVFVPNHVRDAINAAIDKALIDLPEAEAFREQIYHQLLNVFHETGEIPDFKLERTLPQRIADLERKVAALKAATEKQVEQYRQEVNRQREELNLKPLWQSEEKS